MKKITLLFAIVISFLLSIGCCASISNINSPQKDLIHHLKNSTASLVERSDNGAYMPYCGAVWVTKKHLVTAKHCIEDENEKVEIGRTVKFQIFKDFDNHYPFSKNKKVYVAKVIAQGKDNEDIALLYALNDVKHGIATVVSYSPQAGQQVHHIGHPQALQFAYINCFISEERLYKAFGHERHVLNIIGFVWYGSSGGGAFDNQGSLLGITSMLSVAPGQGLFVHPKIIKSFLDKNKVKYNTLN